MLLSHISAFKKKELVPFFQKCPFQGKDSYTREAPHIFQKLFPFILENQLSEEMGDLSTKPPHQNVFLSSLHTTNLLDLNHIPTKHFQKTSNHMVDMHAQEYPKNQSEEIIKKEEGKSAILAIYMSTNITSQTNIRVVEPERFCLKTFMRERS